MSNPEPTAQREGGDEERLAARSVPAAAAPLVVITRGPIVESVHRGAIAVSRGDALVAAAGDGRRVLYVRSAIKPFVAALVVRDGAAARFGLESRHLAAIAASHGGRDEDVRFVHEVLEQSGVDPAELRNGSDEAPADEATPHRMMCAGAEPDAVRQMCSGEHAGLLALCRCHGWPTDGYWREDHPVQRLVAEMVRAVFGDPDAPPLPTAIDNCAVPTFQVTLNRIARASAWLIEPSLLPAALNAFAAPFAVVRDAMRAHPVTISGPGQVDTDLCAVASPDVIAKEGAEGLIAVGVRGEHGEATGLAVSIEDGDKTRRATKIATLGALHQLALLPADELGRLEAAHVPKLQDSQGRSVGSARVAFELTSR